MKKEDIEVGRWYYFRTSVQFFSGQCWEMFENVCIMRRKWGNKYMVPSADLIGETPDPRWFKIRKPPGH